MKPIASRSIWFESFPQLVTRWWDMQPASVRSQAGEGPADAVERAIRRAERVIEACGAAPMRQLRNSREWEARWNAEDAWKTLAAALDRMGWDAVRDKAGTGTAHLAKTALFESDREAVVVAEAPLEEQRRFAVEQGLLLPLTTDDLAAMALARELYQLAVEKLGSSAAPWTEQLARHEFCRRILGLPFSPLVLELLQKK